MGLLDKAKEAAKKAAELAEAQANANWEKRPDWYKRAPVGAVTVRTYREDQIKQLEKDIETAARYGWTAEQVGGTSGHINVGRTALRVATGIGLIFGASRTKGNIVVKFTRQSASS
jgi:hypothetical protein